MIKVTKQKEPNILTVNQAIWTQELLDDIKTVGNYESLPDEKKKNIASRYKHPEIKNSLIPVLDTKCVFCETIPNESGYVEVEHFFPKSIYPEDTYSWKNLLPSCYDGRIASFTGCLESARRFSKGNGLLIICDTQETLQFEARLYKPGQYKHTFYPLFKVLEIAKKHGGWGFSDRLLEQYAGEQEYIMRVDLANMHTFKWVK